MFEPCVTPKHHKQKTPDAETRENRSFQHQLQEGVEQKLRWCESSSAKQPTVYTRHTARTQVFHRSRKKYLKRKHWTLPHAKTFVNQKQCPSKNSPFKYVWPMCYSQRSQAKNARCRHRREQVISTSTPKRSGTCFTMVWIIECKATDSLHKTCGNDTSLPSKQKKTSQKEALDLTTRQNICKAKTMPKQKFAFQICLTHVLFPNITSKKRHMQRQVRTGHFHVHSKEEWNMFYDGVNNRVQSNRQFTQDLRQWHKSSIEAGKKFLTRKYWTLQMTK